MPLSSIFHMLTFLATQRQQTGLCLRDYGGEGRICRRVFLFGLLVPAQCSSLYAIKVNITKCYIAYGKSVLHQLKYRFLVY